MDSKSPKVYILPQQMTIIRATIDPFNDNNYYIFGSKFNNKCWYFNNQNKETFNEISDIPKANKQKQDYGHGCAIFETPKNKNKYALMYGGSQGNATYNIYDFQINAWNKNAIKLNNLWFYNENEMCDQNRTYGFGVGLSMITDLFEKNKIHIIGGGASFQKYGYFEFNEEIINNCELS